MSEHKITTKMGQCRCRCLFFKLASGRREEKRMGEERKKGMKRRDTELASGRRFVCMKVDVDTTKK